MKAAAIDHAKRYLRLRWQPNDLFLTNRRLKAIRTLARCRKA